MNRNVTHAPRNAMLLGIATTLAGVGALVWRNTRHRRETRALRSLRPERPGTVPVWAQASAIVASSASALLLLVRNKE
jgi:hypothetical protein